MQFAFDLISDLHIETWPESFDWTAQATSPVCIVAGDVCRDQALLLKTLKHLGTCYRAVFYIDGNDEHKDHITRLDSSYQYLSKQIERIPNVVYLQDNVVVIDGVAIVGTSGWWAFDFDSAIDSADSMTWYTERHGLGIETAQSIAQMSVGDALYMSASIKRLQTHPDVKKIIMVTHTVPDPALVSHDIDLSGTPRMNTTGNRYMMQALAADTEKKIHTWCFGHYHGSVDQVRSGVRFVNNCRGRGDTPYSQHVYYPRRIVINY
jgi:predicted phosphodiesterase